MAMEEDLTLGGGPYVILLTDVTPINLIKNEIIIMKCNFKRRKSMSSSGFLR